MMKTIFYFLIWALGNSFAIGVELTIRDGMTLGDFYGQGIYPSQGGKDEIEFILNPLTLSAGHERKLLEMKACIGSFTFSVRGELHGGKINSLSYIPTKEAAQLLLKLADRLGVQPKVFPPNTSLEQAGSRWGSVGINFKIPDSQWTVMFLAKRDEERVYLHAFFDKPTTRREDTEFMQEWRSAPMLKEPEEWSHLPLRGEWRGLDREVTNFTHLVSSYDDEGKLLPEFAKRMEEIEGETSLAVSKPNSQPRQRGNRTPEAENLPPATKSWNKWIGVALFVVVLSAGYFVYEKRKSRLGTKR